MKNSNLVRLLHLTDPTLPIGGFTHSMGLETYVQNGLVYDLPSAREFVVQMLIENIQFNDAAFVSLAYDASNDLQHLLKLDEECSAFKIPRETKEASRKLGMRLIRLLEDQLNKRKTKRSERMDLNDLYHTETSLQFIGLANQKQTDANYCVVFGMFSSLMKIDKVDALTGYYYNQCVSMVTNAVKLIPLGQREGQKLLFSLHNHIEELAQRSLYPDLDLLGKSCPAFDLRCIQHETLYTRLYIS